jgi:hypothetical protein
LDTLFGDRLRVRHDNDNDGMSHAVKRQRESPEKEAARKEKERTLLNEYRTLVEDVMKRVLLTAYGLWS